MKAESDSHGSRDRDVQNECEPIELRAAAPPTLTAGLCGRFFPLADVSTVVCLEEFTLPRVNRMEICAAGEIQVFHLIDRCVRRTFLRGEDSSPGKDYSHRR